ncbi:helix-turn-helix domain-containing protein [Qipengyuania spongiae]|uniref:Helix-turn-helix domain-containing protein n=1 Tax=Qipengyuania spongiae TaxID=2909673 RepID=A0ABY5SZF1_9SPHN|nr:helix-turn-helix domain-containing protein [Qipengyuania spongiae]UVI39908.1 helix-turn-helix domain-containing protein [Qipengyuania spongiae]
MHDGGVDCERGESRLTPASRFTLDYLGSPPELADHVTTFYHFRCDELQINDIQPAAVGHLVLFAYGNGVMSRPGGGSDPSYEVNLLTPFAQAAPFAVDGPFHAIGAALTPLGWAALTGLCAKTHANRLYDAGSWLDSDLVTRGHALCAAYREGRMDGKACARELGMMIRGALRDVNPGHARLIAATNAWLARALVPDLGALYAESGYCRRQTQRLVERYFGVSPMALRRKYRALRTAALLSLPTLTDEYEAEIAEAFYDQSHMIRELRLFAGRTPARLGDGDSPILNEMLDAKNLRELGNGDQEDC